MSTSRGGNSPKRFCVCSRWHILSTTGNRFHNNPRNGKTLESITFWKLVFSVGATTKTLWIPLFFAAALTKNVDFLKRCLFRCLPFSACRGHAPKGCKSKFMVNPWWNCYVRMVSWKWKWRTLAQPSTRRGADVLEHIQLRKFIWMNLFEQIQPRNFVRTKLNKEQIQKIAICFCYLFSYCEQITNYHWTKY